MKWETIKKNCADNIFMEIKHGMHHGGETAIYALKKMLESGKLNKSGVATELANKAYDAVMNWDIRNAGELATYFPKVVPRFMTDGSKYSIDFGEDGWEINKSESYAKGGEVDAPKKVTLEYPIRKVDEDPLNALALTVMIENGVVTSNPDMGAPYAKWVKDGWKFYFEVEVNNNVYAIMEATFPHGTERKRELVRNEHIKKLVLESKGIKHVGEGADYARHYFTTPITPKSYEKLKRMLLDSGFSHRFYTPGNEFKNGNRNTIAIIGKEQVNLTTYTPFTGRLLDSKAFNTEMDLAKYLDEAEYFELGGHLNGVGEDFMEQMAGGGDVVIGEGANTYKAFYKGKNIEVKADTSYAAQKTAAAHFKAKHSYDVTVVILENSAGEVIHSTSEFAKGGSVGKTWEAMNREERMESLEQQRDGFPKGSAPWQRFNNALTALNGRGGNGTRVDEMLASWKKDGRAHSRLGNNDMDFFEKVGVPYGNLGITSATGSDVVYYDTSKYANGAEALGMKMEKGGGIPKDVLMTGKIKSYEDFKKVLEFYAKISSTGQEFAAKVKAELKQHIPQFFSAVRRDILKVSDADWTKWQTTMQYDKMAKVNWESVYDALVKKKNGGDVMEKGGDMKQDYTISFKKSHSGKLYNVLVIGAPSDIEASRVASEEVLKEKGSEWRYYGTSKKKIGRDEPMEYAGVHMALHYQKKKFEDGGEIEIESRFLVMHKVNTMSHYDFYIGADDEGKQIYNIVPEGSPVPTGGYYTKRWIAERKNVSPNGFIKNYAEKAPSYEIIEPAPYKIIGFVRVSNATANADGKDNHKGFAVFEADKWDKEHGADFRIGRWIEPQYIFDEETKKLAVNPQWWNRPAIKSSAKTLTLMGDNESWDTGEKLKIESIEIDPRKGWAQNSGLWEWFKYHKEQDKDFKIKDRVAAVMEKGGEVPFYGDPAALGVAEGNRWQVADPFESEKYAKGGEISKGSPKKFYDDVKKVIANAESLLEELRYKNSDVDGLAVDVKLGGIWKYGIAQALDKLKKKHKLNKEQMDYLEHEYDEDWMYKKESSWEEWEREQTPDLLLEHFPSLNEKEIGFYGRSAGHLVFTNAESFEDKIAELNVLDNYFNDKGEFTSDGTFKDFMKDTGSDIIESAKKLAEDTELYANVAQWIKDAHKNLGASWQQELDYRLGEAYDEEKAELKNSAKGHAEAVRKEEARKKAEAHEAETNPPFPKNRKLVITTTHGKYFVNYLGLITQAHINEFSGGWKLSALMGIDYELDDTYVVLPFAKMTEAAVKEKVAKGYYDEQKQPKFTIRDLDHGTMREWGERVTNLHFEEMSEPAKKYWAGGDIENSVLGKEYFKKFKIKGNGRREYSIFQSNSDSAYKQAVRQLFPKMTYAEHEKRAKKYAELYMEVSKEYNKKVDEEFLRVFKRPYQATDYKVSGIVRDEFSPEAKDAIRKDVDTMAELYAAISLHNSVLNKADKVSIHPDTIEIQGVTHARMRDGFNPHNKVNKEYDTYVDYPESDHPAIRHWTKGKKGIVNLPQGWYSFDLKKWNERPAEKRTEKMADGGGIVDDPSNYYGYTPAHNFHPPFFVTGYKSKAEYDSGKADNAQEFALLEKAKNAAIQLIKDGFYVVEISDTKWSLFKLEKGEVYNSLEDGHEMGRFKSMEKGGEVSKEEKPEHYRYISLQKVPNGLKVIVNDEGREEIKDDEEKGEDYIWGELFDNVQGNSEYLFHPDGGAVGFGLTSAPMITDGYYYNDNAKSILDSITDKGHEKDSEVYAYMDYEVLSPLEQLVKNGEVVFERVTKRTDKKEKGGMIHRGNKKLDALNKKYAKKKRFNDSTAIEDLNAYFRTIVDTREGDIEKKNARKGIIATTGSAKAADEYIKKRTALKEFPEGYFEKGGTIDYTKPAEIYLAGGDYNDGYYVSDKGGRILERGFATFEEASKKYFGGKKKKPVYKLGDLYVPSFDYEGMLKMGEKAPNMSVGKLEKLRTSFSDVNFRHKAEMLSDAIALLKDNKQREGFLKLKELSDACKEEIATGKFEHGGVVPTTTDLPRIMNEAFAVQESYKNDFFLEHGLTYDEFKKLGKKKKEEIQDEWVGSRQFRAMNEAINATTYANGGNLSGVSVITSAQHHELVKDKNPYEKPVHLLEFTEDEKKQIDKILTAPKDWDTVHKYRYDYDNGGSLVVDKFAFTTWWFKKYADYIIAHKSFNTLKREDEYYRIDTFKDFLEFLKEFVPKGAKEFENGGEIHIPTITYDHIHEGENKGKVQIFADGKPLVVTEYAKDGWITCSQENTLSKVTEIARRYFPEFNLPYLVDQGSGYVSKSERPIIYKLEKGGEVEKGASWGGTGE